MQTIGARIGGRGVATCLRSRNGTALKKMLRGGESGMRATRILGERATVEMRGEVRGVKALSHWIHRGLGDTSHGRATREMLSKMRGASLGGRASGTCRGSFSGSDVGILHFARRVARHYKDGRALVARLARGRHPLRVSSVVGSAVPVGRNRQMCLSGGRNLVGHHSFRSGQFCPGRHYFVRPGHVLREHHLNPGTFHGAHNTAWQEHAGRHLHRYGRLPLQNVGYRQKVAVA